MPLAPAKFGSQEFFEKTAFYGSQGRGLFKIDQLPATIDNYVLSGAKGIASNYKQQLINRAQILLRDGIVAKNISSPSSTLATFEEFSYIGPTRKHPHTQIFGPITVEFYLKIGRAHV